MAAYDEELLEAAQRLLARRTGQRGKLAAARIRRSISTSYYALFHFILDEVSLRVVGAGNGLRVRRRILARTLAHAGVKTALDKVRGASADVSVADFLRQDGGQAANVAVPAFVQKMAKAFADAQAKRHDADYDLNKSLSEVDARLLHARVGRVIAAWRGATSRADRDFKHALCVLILLKGKLRADQ
ncbi:hypothetical protein [Phenylobacterium sp.]|uniref:hypothetical protein n=1 Tax=Phenylobacterium sp. TaxID=1871053 RepID=UPI0025FA8BBB|nr:hypothetical protein [Phenylobacterium sp.]MBX3482205.1 hypothetical protein [Phenylobacterium sp.]